MTERGGAVELVDADGGNPTVDSSVTCPECEAADVRPSRHLQKGDREKLASGGSFWRCGNCGVRFLGPKSRRRRSAEISAPDRARREDEINRAIRLRRIVHRWVLPILVLVAMMVVVIYVLDKRHPVEEAHSIAAP